MPIISVEMIEIFLLILFRISTMLVLMPVFSSNVIPARIKIAISILLTFVLLPTIDVPAAAYEPDNLIQFFILASQEVFIGITIAFVWNLLFFTMKIAGSITGFQMSFFVASVIDPEKGVQTPIISELYFVAAMLLFLAINGHYQLINSLINSFHEIPFGNLFMGSALFDNLVHIFQDTFVFALKIAFPIIATLILVEIGFGLIARVAPQMNIFMVSFPLKIAAGILIFMYSLPYIRYVFSKTYFYFSKNVFTIISGISGGV